MTKNRFYTTLIIGLLLSCSSIFAQSAKQKELEQQRQQVLKEMKQINALLFSKKKEEKSAVTLIEDLNYKVSVRKNLIRITNEQANLLTREINANQKEITSLRTQLQELKDDYAAMVVKSYKSKSEQSKVMFLLSSDNFKQAYKRLQYIKQYTNYQKEQGEAIKTKTKELQDLNIQLSKQKKDKDKLIEENRIAKRELEEELKQREVLVASLKKEMSKYANQVKQKQREAARLDKEIDRIIKETIAASNKKTGKTSSSGKFVLTPEAKKLSSNFESNKGRLGWPVSRGVVKIKYGKQRSLIDNTVTQNYQSIYIATEAQADVKSVFSGEVSRVLIIKNGNPAVFVRHGIYFSVYMNLSQVNVKKGDKVEAGQVIGKVFTNKIKGESLLGFRIYKNDQVINPEPWLARF
ncbi:septal ring factor EnvC (AmiA/AmiB activator) [Winogradskyella epiphytica]|uniref:Septal ring factor EnvC (AmiA/AmiB activator) n=1 Tax=Winogradskyella epiphytica TaxID=262005 RepID=A0A2V4XWS7_9FLAO|nr:peptidoglycan DD-metalloendopeptidase family protein [Winogradskyella epiphytica]PYE83257.1 septal ring factor EnvC (AmiA/AmiB activator) [Winogradskyella epiphytica]GGW56897.1 peptidase M23 [Winogradskyella epiphytica]